MDADLPSVQFRRFRWKYPWTIFGLGATVTGWMRSCKGGTLTRNPWETHGKRATKYLGPVQYLPQNDWAFVGILRYVFTWSNIECCGIWLDTTPTGFIYTSLDLNYPRHPNSSKIPAEEVFLGLFWGSQPASDQGVWMSRVIWSQSPWIPIPLVTFTIKSKHHLQQELKHPGFKKRALN